MQFPYGPLAPDQGETTAPFTMLAENVLPKKDGYGPLKGLQVPATSDALPDAPKGIKSLVLRDGTWKVFGFTSDDWYELGDDFTWTSLGATFSLTAGDHWSPEQFGSMLLGSNTSDGLQQYNVETPAGFTHISDAGKPREIFSCANVMIGLDCLDNSGSRDNRLIRNSAINDQTNWKTKGADYQPLEDGGALIVGRDITGNAAFIGQERAIRMMQFGDAPGGALYSLQKMVDGIGPVSARGTVVRGGMCYFPVTDGLVRYPFGARDVERIGAGAVDDWWLERVDLSNMTLTQAVNDPSNKIIWFRWKRITGVSDDIFTDLLGFSWQWNKWVMATVSTSYLVQIATPGYTLDGMDDFGPLDGIDIPLDDRFWQGGQPVFAAMDENYKFGTFSGNNLAATIRSFVGNSPVTGLIGWATPLSDDASMTLALGVKDDVADAIAWKTAQSKRNAGRVPLRGRGMNIQFESAHASAADWSYDKGVDYVVSAIGGPG
jgi:hypothetical protein